MKDEEAEYEEEKHESAHCIEEVAPALVGRFEAGRSSGRCGARKVADEGPSDLVSKMISLW